MKGIIILFILAVALIPTPVHGQGHRIMTDAIKLKVEGELWKSGITQRARNG